MKIKCAFCGKRSERRAGDVGRARRIGAPLFCNMACAGKNRRKGKTKAQLVEEKRLYDQAYRVKNLARIKADKAAHYQATRDPEKERAYRKANMARHVEYCRRPEYRAKKHEYDAKRYAEQFGPFGDCHRILQELNAEIASRMSKYEVYMANGRYDKYAERRRERRLTSEEFHRRG